MSDTIPYSDFAKVDIRVGTITAVDDFPEARKPAYRLTIDFGPEIGTRRSSAQLVQESAKEELLGKQVLAVVNFAPKRIGPFSSEVLTLGVPGGNGGWVVVSPIKNVENGGRLS